MTPAKRAFDLVFALLLLPVLAPVVAAVGLWILLADGRPVFYLAERMKAPGEPFLLWKFRTMTTVAADAGVSGGDKSARVTRTGRLLRRYRLDELPQIWNILKGDMSFVGPRPPLRQYVERFPALYAQVLQSRPGVTGLASLVYHRHEERILAACATAQETDAAYCRRCIPAKARLDLIYQNHRSICFDLVLIGRTVARVLR
ncbi:sugar transferase [Phaeovulum sp. NW3]|uniref:sugar transferase n=1 Tax=Phaeovulum sp. NW3 TaxID=2934933 RepID=UPI0020217FB5|nr:sugar transferase [Phaeovulum sp. NW3]MCL7464546.1 sugar transferase [Phaeovulum sp. NW3]